ncbi:hypothetical protein HUJ05_012427 [Dendroctonus ponderosae]|nr:hypothetical protein HUJ05_012427 [Dendroctonus ponderosae]
MAPELSAWALAIPLSFLGCVSLQYLFLLTVNNEKPLSNLPSVLKKNSKIMEVFEDIAKWLKDMGYDGRVPANLLSICNQQTSHIWKQLIASVRPREEAETVKLNVIRNRLKIKPIDQQESFPFKVKEMEAYNHKLNLEKKLEPLKETVEMNKLNVKQMYAKYKMKEIALKVLKSKVDENEERQFLLESKMELLKQQHLEAEQLVSKLESVIPDERDQNSTIKDISPILEQCALKLKRLVMEDEELKMEELSNISMQSNSRLKQSLRTPQGGDQTAYGTRDDQESGIFPFVIEGSSFLESSRLTNCTPMRCNSQSFFDFNLSIPATPVTLNGAKGSVFKVPNTTLMKKNMKSDHSSKKVYNHPEVTKECRKILQENDVELIYQTLKHLNGNAVTELQQIVQKERLQTYQVGNKKIPDRDLARLAFIHVDTEMKIRNQSREMKELLEKINSRKEHILTSFTGGNKAQLEERLERALMQISFNTTMAATLREINDQQFSTSRVEAENFTSKVQKIKLEINSKLQLIQFITNEMSQAVKYMRRNQDSFSNSNWRLRSFTFDPSWMNSLLNNTWVKEMLVFKNVPLDYQRQCTNSNLFYRDLSPTWYSNSIQMGHQELQLLVDILDGPFDAPETILLRITNAKMKLDALKTMSNSLKKNKYFDGQTKYSSEELMQQESYLIQALDSLKGLVVSSKSYETLAASEVVKRSFQIWIEAPMADFISDRRTVEGHNYQYFRKKLANLL